MNVSLRDLLQAGVHFGHQTRRWNPKMRQYIYGAKNGIHIIDLQKTAKGLVDGTRFINQVAARGGKVLFVGTKRAAREIVAEEAGRCGMFYMNNRWLGGTLTNWQTVKKSLDRLNALTHARDEGRFDLLTKKEALELNREIAKMEKNLGGIREMKKLPDVMFVIDPKKEHLAIKEAATLNIPVVALCDTNCDPSNVQVVIPGNDDALKSIRLFTASIADAVTEGTQAGSSREAAGYQQAAAQDVEIIQRKGAAAPAAETPEAGAEA